MGRRYTSGEILKAKAAWEARCVAEEMEEPEHEEHRTIVVEADEHSDWTLALNEDDVLVVGVVSDVPVSAWVGRESDYRRWRNDEDTGCLDQIASVLVGELTVAARSDNRFVIWVENATDDDATVTIDIAVWDGAGDDDE